MCIRDSGYSNRKNGTCRRKTVSRKKSFCTRKSYLVHFYTNVQKYKDFILARGIKNGEMAKTLREALIIKYEGEIAEARANIQVYLANPVGIGEHPDIISAMDTQIEKMAHAEEKLLAVRNHFVPSNEL